MSGQPEYTHDVFISYSQADQDWVRQELLPRLEQARLKVFVDYRDFELGLPRFVNIEHAIKQSRKILIVLTPGWAASEWANFETLLAQTKDPAGHLRRMLPLLLEPCDPPERIAILTHADFTQPASREAEMRRLLQAIGTKARIFISYKRNVEPDEPLAKQIYDALIQAGHLVFIDQTMPVGVEWARTRAADRC